MGGVIAPLPPPLDAYGCALLYFLILCFCSTKKRLKTCVGLTHSNYRPNHLKTLKTEQLDKIQECLESVYKYKIQTRGIGNLLPQVGIPQTFMGRGWGVDLTRGMPKAPWVDKDFFMQINKFLQHFLLKARNLEKNSCNQIENDK